MCGEQRWLVALGALWLFGVVPSLAAPAERTSPVAERLEGLVANEMGVDRAGNVWAWVRSRDQVVLYAPGGEVLASTRVPGASALDVDHEWGIVGIYDFRRTLRLLSFDGKVETQRPLPDSTGSVAWIDRSRVAIGPTEAGYRIGLLSLEEGARVSPMGEARPIGDEPGAEVLRRMVLELDPKRGHLYSLDSFTGDLAIFALDGRLVRAAKVESPGPERFADWLGQLDRQAKAEGDRQRPFMGLLELEVDDSGVAWVVEQCDKESGLATLVGTPLEGAIARHEIEAECCSHNFVLLERTWLMNRVPLPGGEHCTASGSLP